MKKREQRLGQSVTFVTKVIIEPIYFHNGRPCIDIIVKREKGHMDYEFQLSGFKKNIPIIVKK